MRSSEFITIYLAIGASIGVASLLNQQSQTSRLRRMMTTLWATLSWPIAVTTMLLSRLRNREQPRRWLTLRLTTRATRRQQNLSVDVANGRLLTLLRQLDEQCRLTANDEHHRARRLGYAIRTVRLEAERYANLRVAVIELKAEDAPTRRETELCRIAGRGEAGLLIAGRCVRRRNLRRLIAHQEQSRASFVQALTRLTESIEVAATPHTFSGATNSNHNNFADALFECIEQAIALANLLADSPTSSTLTDLLNSLRVRLNNPEAADLPLAFVYGVSKH